MIGLQCFSFKQSWVETGDSVMYYDKKMWEIKMLWDFESIFLKD